MLSATFSAVIVRSFSPHSTFGMVDSEETCCVVMVYNMADSWGVLIGDTVVVPEPQVKRHSITHNDKVHTLIRDLTPTDTVIGMHRVPPYMFYKISNKKKKKTAVSTPFRICIRHS